MRKRSRGGSRQRRRDQGDEPSTIRFLQSPRVLNSCIERSDDSLLRLFNFTRDLMQQRETGEEQDEDEEEEKCEVGHGEISPRWGDWRPFMVSSRRVCEAGRVMSFDDAVLSKMSAEQLQALYLVEAGVSMFITGPGGTGKSEIISCIVEAGQRCDKKVVVTASTGIAAKNIRGTTLHRFARMGIRIANLDVKKMRFTDPRLVCWRECDVLIVDEVSMLDVAFLSTLDKIATHARVNKGAGLQRPFGGIQLIFLGDFAQLTSSNSNSPLFTTHEWCRMVPFTVELRTIFRQRDGLFKDLLNRIRLGQVKRGDLLTLNRRIEVEEPPIAEVEADQQLFSDHLSSSTPSSSTLSSSTPSSSTPSSSTLSSSTPSSSTPSSSTLSSSTLSSSTPSSSTLSSSTPSSSSHAVTLCAFRKMVKRRNDEAISKLGEPIRTFASGEDDEDSKVTCLCVGSKVLLTRNTDLSRGLVNGSLGVVVGFHETNGWPVVAWNGGDEVSVVEPVERFQAEQEEEEQEAAAASKRGDEAKSYVPLMCAWAMTVHRAQGMTLTNANVHAQSMKSNALLYTALSRVKTLDGLRIVGQVSEENVVADPVVVKYYKKLAALVDKQSSEMGSHLAVVPSTMI